ncbi:TIGR00374 family protein [Longibacter salinarum]|uniref:TIGR00374 family protein n=1 Tax=Longibacter salinarum TaxID=1850348 RepID=A0A2A8D2W3_9BACT|nr:lysylphosphatidylglycerol synthase transmembrane domain-containing protein [Longibacter salinarum]PEN15230.1 TIGR00374 family protein [Longibacter salinarum]
MTRRFRRRLLQVGSFVLAAGLLYLAFRGIDVDTITRAFRQANYRWVPVLVVLVIVANWMRAWRWQVLLEALPSETARSDTERPPEPKLSDSFASVMIGYMVNYAAPRMGEFARTANMSTQSRLRFSSVFGTVVVERVFDTAVLGFAILSSGILLIDRMPVVRQTFVDPVLARLEALPALSLALWILAGIAVVAGIAGLLWRLFQNEQSALRQMWTSTLQPALVSFKDGFMTLRRSPRRWTIVWTTIGMWGGYLLMAYIPFRMLGLAGPYDISLVDAWILMAIGSLGLLVPSPGGIGSYHYVTIQALVLLYSMPEGSSASYAVLTHAAQLVFYTIAGLLALVHQGGSFTRLFQQRPSDVDASASEEETSPINGERDCVSGAGNTSQLSAASVTKGADERL